MRENAPSFAPLCTSSVNRDCDFLLTVRVLPPRYVHQKAEEMMMAWRPILTVIVNPQPIRVVSRSRARLRLVVNGPFILVPTRDKPR
ncbi:hypothetical protein [Atlantibacter sp. RC6]|uniref:hypothetical protein n=1 Tax=Atlantibacter sp. RC6 TaxID=2587036 RepID=UPI0016058166|nr:hypothetical protein [Atlantibacter sp. RC6]MBB3321079.1 hypothetical protein [Atlantibacter sp. RC6]